MANNIKGITVEIGGNTGPLNQALKDVNKAARETQSELREVNKQLKFDPQNATLTRQKIDLLKNSVQELTTKQATLKDAVRQAQDQFEKGDLGADKVRAVEREYQKVTSQLKDAKTQLNDVEKTSGTVGERIKANFKSVGAGIKAAFTWDNIKSALGGIGIAAAGLLKSSLSEASEAQTVNANLAQTLKSTGGAAGMTKGALDELAESLSKNTTFEDDQVKSGEAMLLTFTQIGKDVFPQATAATLDYAQKMGVDAKSAALTLGKALNDPATGLSKLTKSGVTFTAQQQEQIKAMQAAGDTAGAQKMMIAELNKEFGGQAAAAANTYEGKQKQLDNTFKELKETIGTALLPTLAKIVQAVAPIIEKIANFVSKNPQLTAAILAVIAVLGILVGGLSLLTTVTGAFGITLDVAILPTIGLVVLAIAALAAGAVLVVTHWQSISGFFVGLWNGIKGVFSGIGDWFGSMFDSAKQAIVNNFSPSALSDHFNSVWKSVQNTFSNLNPVKWGRDLIDGIANGIKSAAQHVNDAVGGVAQNIRSFLHFSEPDEGPLKGFHGWWKDMMYGMADDITSHLDPVRSAVKGVAATLAGNIGVHASTLMQGSTAGLTQTTSSTSIDQSRKVEQNFYGDIKADTTGGKASTLQQLQFLATIG